MVLRIFTKSTFSKKVRKNLDFWSRIRRPKRRKIKKKMCWKTYVFLTSIFLGFLAIFYDFGSILGGQKSSNNRKKHGKKRFWDAFEARFRFWIDFGSDFGGILNDFGWILEDLGWILDGFWEDSRTILEAFGEHFVNWLIDWFIDWSFGLIFGPRNIQHHLKKLASMNQTLMIRATRGRSMDGCMDGWMDGRTDGQTDGWMDGWNGWDGWMDGWME